MVEAYVAQGAAVRKADEEAHAREMEQAMEESRHTAKAAADLKAAADAQAADARGAMVTARLMKPHFGGDDFACQHTSCLGLST